MKEILRHLRKTNSFTQEEIARRLEISRQSYIKYESGEVEPGDKIIRALSIIYDVREDFIRRNEVPNPGRHKNDVTYRITPAKELCVASPPVIYGADSFSPERRRDLLTALLVSFEIPELDKRKIISALQRRDFLDFEDCLQDECASGLNADFIITRNPKDFENSKVRALTPEEFMKLKGV